MCVCLVSVSYQEVQSRLIVDTAERKDKENRKIQVVRKIKKSIQGLGLGVMYWFHVKRGETLEDSSLFVPTSTSASASLSTSCISFPCPWASWWTTIADWLEVPEIVPIIPFSDLCTIAPVVETPALEAEAEAGWRWRCESSPNSSRNFKRACRRLRASN